ncbi:hypothetical protein J5X84_12605 [Streptosporangiaceae bacterium NEAU-GS5]|nr:hypothetical protein [Streptosporangiaceae bacterium NEAU-GS5]
MRPLGVFLALAPALALTAACGSAPVAKTQMSATQEVYVFNTYGAEEGRVDQRPADLVLSEFSTLNSVAWRSWGPTRALGTGKLSGSWCLPECADAPYDATVTLNVVQPVRGKAYFTRYELSAQLPPKQRESADLEGRLPTP